jgi:transposase
VLFLDETGLMLQPLVRRTWAPMGRRPVMYCWDRHDRLSVIAGLTLSRCRHRVGLYFTIQQANVRTTDVEMFIRQVQRQIGRPLLVVMDRLPGHRAAAKRLAGDRRFGIEWLPGYAPDLNPVEALWSQTKYAELANYVPQDVLDLEVQTEVALAGIEKSQQLLRSFFRAAILRI